MLFLLFDVKYSIINAIIFGGIMYTIKDSYEQNGTTYKIRNINFQSISDLGESNWRFITESHKKSTISFMSGGSDLKESSIIYQDLNNPTRGIRIYGDYADYKYTYYDDHDLILSLQKRQPKVKLTEFPTGIVTIEDKIIGQEMPFYEGYQNIDKFLQGDSSLLVTHYYLEIIKIVKELCDNGIYFYDLHPGNVVVSGKNVRIIDFESTFLDIDPKDADESYDRVLVYLKVLINRLNELKGIDIKNDLKKCWYLEEVNDCVMRLHKSLTSK